MSRFDLLALWALSLLAAVPALAQTVTIDGNGESRGELLAQIVPEGSAEVIWKNPSLADEPVQGHFEGSTQLVLKEILAPADFAAIYGDDGDGGLKISKLIVLDKETAAAGPAQTTPVVEPPPNQALQQQRRLQQQQQLKLQRQQMPRGQPPRIVNGQMVPPGANRLRQRRLPQQGVQLDQ